MPAESKYVVDKLSVTTEATMGQSKYAGTRKLIICFLGIFISYFAYGILQEKITKAKYGEEKQMFTYTLAMVFIQCVVNAAFAEGAIRLTGSAADNSSRILYATMSMSYLCAMLSSMHALQFVSYPTQVLGKSVKPIPVMLLGVCLAHKRYPLAKYLFVLLIVIGVTLFMYKGKNSSKALDADHTIGWGELLLATSLLLDGVTGGIQDKIRSERKTETHRMMLRMNLWSVLYLAVALVLTGEGLEFLIFASNHPHVLLLLIILSICSAVGQNFIFMSITNFGPLTCSIITTTRKFFTILASIIIFQHPMALNQWIGTVLVFVGLGLDIGYGKETKPRS